MIIKGGILSLLAASAILGSTDDYSYSSGPRAPLQKKPKSKSCVKRRKANKIAKKQRKGNHK